MGIDAKIVGRRALIGRGFLGQTLAKPGRFTDFYHSQNIDQLSGHYDLIVIAAPGAEKWRANARPHVDQYQVNRLTEALGQVTADRVVLLSTIDASKDHAYGRHRRGLEAFVGTYFDGMIVRLPALYGSGLRKNALYDLLQGRPVANQRYIWYPVSRLWSDLQAYCPGLWPTYGAPLTMGEIADRLGIRVEWLPYDSTNDYNEDGPFLMSSQDVLEDIAQWAKTFVCQ